MVAINSSENGYHSLHNHPLLDDTKIFTCKLGSARSLLEDQKEYIRTHVMAGESAANICSYLRTKYPERKFVQKDISNLSHQTRTAHAGPTAQNASLALTYLQTLQDRNDGFQFWFQIDENFQLTNLFWVTAKEKEAYQRYGDVVMSDVTAKVSNTTLKSWNIVGINNNFETQSFGHALMFMETANAHEWVLDHFFKAHGGKMMKVHITDDDHAVEAVFNLPKYHGKFVHILCIYHLGMINLPKALKPVLGTYYRKVMDMWWSARNAVTPEAFLNQWEVMMAYVETINSSGHAAEYLRQLESRKSKWALCFTKTIFTCHAHASSRVEQYQRAIKQNNFGANETLSRHIEKVLKVETLKFDRTNLREFNRSLKCTTASSDAVYHAFKTILCDVSSYGSPWLEKVLFANMNDCLQYIATISTITQACELEEEGSLCDHLVKPIETASSDIHCDDPTLLELNSQKDREQTLLDKAKELQSSSKLQSLTELLKIDAVVGKVHQVFKVISSIYNGQAQFIISLIDGSHICTCLLLINCGIYCKHFFRVMLDFPNLCAFNITGMSRRWFQEQHQADGYSPPSQFHSVDNASELFNEHICKDKFGSIFDGVTANLSGMSRAASLSAQQHSSVQKRVLYANNMAVAKKATELALERGDTDALEKLASVGLSVIRSLCGPEEVRNPEVIRSKGAPKKRMASTARYQNVLEVHNGSKRKSDPSFKKIKVDKASVLLKSQQVVELAAVSLEYSSNNIENQDPKML